MAQADFIHLRVHTAYSLSEGAIKIDELVDLCRREDMPAVAVTDSGNLFGALEFSLAAAGCGVQPIVGCQLAIARSNDDESFNGNGGARGGVGRDARDALVVLVQNEAGYANLLQLASKAYLDSPDGPRLSLEDVEAPAEGLIALTGGFDGAVGRLLAEGQIQLARGMLERLALAFPGRLYVELTRHGLEIERRIEDDLVDLAYTQDLPLVATNDVYFADAGMYEAHDVLLCVAENAHVSETERRRLTPDHRFRSAAEMRALFADLPEAVANTVVVAQRCAFMPETRDPILPPFATPPGVTEADMLRAEAERGLEARLEAHVYAAGMEPAARDAAAAPYR